MSPHLITLVASIFFVSLGGSLFAQDTEQKGTLTFTAEFKHELLKRPASVSVSRDGKFLYTAGYMRQPTCLVLEHDREKESITLVDSLTDPSTLSGTTSIRLSADDQFACTASYASQAVTLFSRDSATGKLTLLDSKNENMADASGMQFPIEAGFSFNGKFVNVLDDVGGVTVFRVSGKGSEAKLEFVEAFRSDQLRGARGLAHHPLSGFLFVACKLSHTLVALSQDDESGKLTIVDVEVDEQDGVTGLYSAFGVTISEDGEFVYSISGMHGNGKDNAIGVFKFDPFGESKLELVEEIFLKRIEFDGSAFRFGGGNEIRVNGRHLVTCGTGTGTLAAFDRNPLTGKLRLNHVIVDRERYRSVAGLAISADGRYLYTACDFPGTINALRITD